MNIIRPSSRAGFTLVELIVTIGVAGVIAVGILGMLQMAIRIVADDKARNGALALTEDTLELVKNLPYERVGTQGGIPNGPLPQIQTTNLNGISYTLTTEIRFIDDELDGKAPQDTIPQDYKRVRVETTWPSRLHKQGSVVLLTDVVPTTTENDTGGGTLSITIRDTYNNPISQASITITAATTTPPVAISTTTNVEGVAIFPGAPACATCYHITATKEGYSEDGTVSPSVVAQPSRPDITLQQHAIVTTDLTIDPLGDITVIAQGYNPPRNVIVGFPFIIHGTKSLGTDSAGQTVWKFEGLYTTSTAGKKVISTLEPDRYVVYANTASAYDIAETDPALPLPLIPSGHATLTVRLVPHTPNTLHLLVLTPAGMPIPDVVATLQPTNGTPLEQNTSSVGQTFFQDLTKGSYTLKLTNNIYQDQDTTFDIEGNETFTVTLYPR